MTEVQILAAAQGAALTVGAFVLLAYAARACRYVAWRISVRARWTHALGLKAWPLPVVLLREHYAAGSTPSEVVHGGTL